MIDLKALFHQTIAALGAGFGGTWAAVAGLASALKVDVAAGKQVVFAAVAAAIAGIAGFVGNLIYQWRQKGRELLGGGTATAQQLLVQAQEAIAAARRELSG